MMFFRALPAAFVAAAALFAGVAGGLSGRGGGAGGPLIVVAPPFGDAEALIEAAGGQPLLPVSGFAVGVSTGADFAERLRGLGALAVLRTEGFGGFCGESAGEAPPPPRATSTP